MSFGGFGGFGQNTNQQQQQQGSAFGTGAGFGGTGSGGGFGSTSSPFGGGTTTGGGLFGNTSSGFGSSGGFGSGTQTQSNPLFGSQNRTGFGASNTSGGGSLFGGGATNTATGGTGFGGFGSTSTPSTGFGGTGTGGGGLFGGKPAGGFGATTGTTGGFGATGGAFGGTTPSTGFGGGTGTAFQGGVPPCEGTGGTPFSPFQEKDSTSSNVTNHYQSISFMQPYSKYSFEELRLADYNQGRRFGNGSGQAGAFGTSAFGSGAGGFGATGQSGFGTTTTPFGGGTSAPSAFGTTQTTGGFGSSGTTSLFGGGAAKPATSLFGGSGTTQGGGGGGLFGTQNTTTGGFGGTTTGTGAFGGGGSSLFGNQQQAAKPLFGSTPSAGGTTFGATGGFGTQQQQTTAANPFGGTTATASPFGTQQQGGTGAFGTLGGQTQNKGGLFGGGFGTNAQQPQTSGGTSLFGGGGTTTGTSLFGGAAQQPQQPQQQQAGGLFGGGAQQAGAGSLFGGGAQQAGQKSLFGTTSTTGTTTGGGPFSGFGNAQNQQQTGGGLFGNQQAQQAQKPSLFGATGGGGSLFGQQPSAQTSSSLFGGQPAQQPAGGLGTSGLFGASQQSQQAQPAPGSLQASVLDSNPYGSQSIFAGLPAPNAPSPGPLATPLSSTMKQKQRTPLPVYKITPNAANRLITPTKRQGYGFSYSAYGSPSSATSTPGGFSGSLLGGSMRGSVNGSFGRSFSKSFSTSNLRKTFEPESESILSPGALSAGTSRLSGGGLKRLTIDRSLRTDLFTRPASTPAAPITNGEETAPPTDKLKKKVSFDSTSPQPPNGAAGEVVLVESKSPEPTPEELGFLRSVRKDGTVNGANGVHPEAPTRADTDTARHGNELAAVPEDGEQPAPLESGPTRPSYTPGTDPQPGEYWMKPSRAEINKMSREQQKRVVGLTVGRHRCGQVTFDEPVDLTSIDLDQIFGGIVDITVRSITVYPDETQKPPLGKGLNVPSTLRIENSWPRGRDRKSPTPLTSGPLFEKHVDRLRKVHNTEFVDYEKDTGTWVFRVPHFTTYGLDYDSDEEAGESHNPSTVGAGPDAPTPKAQSHSDLDRTMDSERTAMFETDESFVGSMAGVDDDTFDFKKSKMVPGSFGNQAIMTDVRGNGRGNFGQEEESFLEEGSTGSTAEHDGDDVTGSSHLSEEPGVESDEDAEMDMAGAFPSNLDHTVEHDDTFHTDLVMDTTQRSMNMWNTPGKSRLDLSGDWADQLRRTISPRKQDRDALREIQNNAFAERLLRDETPTKPSATTATARQKGFSTSIDLMNSLFQQPRKQQAQPQSPFKKQAAPKDFEWPYHKQPITFADQPEEMSASDVGFHQSFKPRWGPKDSLICAKNDMRETLPDPDKAWEQGMSVTSEGRDVVVLAYGKSFEWSDLLLTQRQMSRISTVDGVPFARLEKPDFRVMTELATDSSERLIWRLANILFNDDIEDDISAGVPPQLRSKFMHRIKKDRLSRMWEEMVREEHTQDPEKFETSEERAFLLLCSHRVDEACKVLLDSGNLHLATLIAQIGRDATTRTDMQKQVEMWRQHNIYSEMSEPIRALYELLAGNALRSEGKSGGVVEDRASTFFLTERFDLDWYQAFGLRLWYGITEDEPVEAAVAKFYDDLVRGGEPAFPSPTPADDRPRSTLRSNAAETDAATRESPLWVLLRSYAASVDPSRGSNSLPAVEIPAALLPESVSGDPLAHRLSFQLCQFLATTQGKDEHVKVDKALADRLTWDFAWELSSSGVLGGAIFVIQHLSQATDRERALKEALARFAAELPNAITEDGSPDPTWHLLTGELQIPEAWLWIAKALYARDRGDAATEVDCLIRAKNWNEAHATFCRVVGPTAIIQRDYATLETLISGFGDGPERRVRGWATGGGGVYDDFMRLATVRASDRDPARLKRLVNALVIMEDRINQGSGVEGLEERVAFREMSRAVAEWVAQDEAQQSMIDLASVLKLPLTADARAMQTAEMGRRYYNVLMAGAY